MKAIVCILTLLVLWGNAGAQVNPVFPVKHSNALSAFSITIDDSKTLTGCLNGEVKLWNAVEGYLLRTYPGLTGQILKLKVSQDQTCIAAFSSDSTLFCWELNSGTVLYSETFRNVMMRDICFIPGTSLLVLSTDQGKVKVYDTKAGYLFKEFDAGSGNVPCVQASLDGKKIFAAVDNEGSPEIWSWETNEWSKIQTFIGHTSKIIALALSPDSTLILSSSSDHTIIVNSISDGKQSASINTGKVEPAFIFMSRNGKMIGVADGNSFTVHLWRISGEKMFDFSTDEGKVLHAFYNNDNNRIHITTSTGKFRIYDLSGVRRHEPGNYCDDIVPCTGGAVSFDGRRIVTGRKNGVLRAFDVELNTAVNVISTVGTEICDMYFATNQKLFAVTYQMSIAIDDITGKAVPGEGAICLIDAASGVTRKKIYIKEDFASSVAISQDGNYLYAGLGSGGLKVFETGSSKEVSSQPFHDYSVLRMSVSDNGKWLVSCSEDATIRLWKTAGGNVSLAEVIPFSLPVISTKFIAGSDSVIAGDDETAFRMIDAKSPLAFSTTPTGMFVSDVASLTDGSVYFASSTKHYTVIHAWSPSSRKTLWKYIQPGTGVLRLAVLKNQKVLAAFLKSGQILFIRISDGKELVRLSLIGEKEWFAWTPEGLYDGSKALTDKVNFMDGIKVMSPELYRKDFYRPGLMSIIFE